MSGTKISALTPLTALADGTIIPVVDTGVNYKITSDKIKTYLDISIDSIGKVTTAFPNATPLNIGTISTTGSQTVNILSAASTSGAKTINIGTNGSTGSTTTINIGTSGGTTPSIVTNGPVKFNGWLQSGGGADVISIGNSGLTIQGTVNLNNTAYTYQLAGSNFAWQSLPAAVNGNTVVGTGAVVLDTWKVYVPNTGNRSLQFTRGAGAVDANFIGSVSTIVGGVTGSATISGATTGSWQYFHGTDNFSNGNVAVYTISDTTNIKTYRITVVYTSATTSSITIERIA